MTEMTIFGRGGQGGVTLAKLIATAYFLRDKHVQAFGVYAAERSGAPLQAYVRIDDDEITNHNQVYQPDHVIVIDRKLIGPNVLTGLKPDGWIILNTPEPPDAYADLFPGRNVATVDGTGIALANHLGTRTVPIVNTTILGAVGRLLGLNLEDVESALAELKFGGGNVTAAREAFERVQQKKLEGEAGTVAAPKRSEHVPGMFDDDVGGLPKIRTGTWATRNPNRRQLLSPCANACPAGNDVQGFIAAVTEKDYTKSLRIILETSPFPGICGRVCPAPCMDACNRTLYDEPVDIREIERYVSEHGEWPQVTKPTRDERVAVVGSGPAGLSAAYHLAKLGYHVTLFEAGDELGGVMRTGIPAYRLPRDVLDEEISFVIRHGVSIKTGRRIERSDLLTLSQEFAAIFVATGLQELRALDLGRPAGDIVVQGIDYLDRARRAEFSVRGERVVVVGGGNTAMDAARTARRQGARNVRIIYRRTRNEMPAIKEEIDEALDEGISLDELVMPVRLARDNGSAILTCTRMKLGEPDESGRRRPIPETSEDALFDLPCERIILALGQSADLSVLPEGAEVRDDGTLLGLTAAPVFLGGDLAKNEGTVTAAIGSGRKAAWHIHRTITGEDLFPTLPDVATSDKVRMHIFSHVPRERAAHVPPEMRRTSFTEVRLGLVDEPGHDAAVAEANRCFSCGVCNFCDRCMEYCPEGILRRDGDGYRFDFDYCKGCGVCASQCPRGVNFMAEL